MSGAAWRGQPAGKAWHPLSSENPLTWNWRKLTGTKRQLKRKWTFSWFEHFILGNWFWVVTYIIHKKIESPFVEEKTLCNPVSRMCRAREPHRTDSHLHCVICVVTQNLSAYIIRWWLQPVLVGDVYVTYEDNSIQLYLNTILLHYNNGDTQSNLLIGIVMLLIVFHGCDDLILYKTVIFINIFIKSLLLFSNESIKECTWATLRFRTYHYGQQSPFSGSRKQFSRPAFCQDACFPPPLFLANFNTSLPFAFYESYFFFF